MLEIERARHGRPKTIAFIGVAAALVLALCLYDAGAQIGIGPRPTTQRATVGAW